MGTDVSTNGADRPNGWGRNGRELTLLTEVGFTPLEAIEAATATGPATVGPQAPRSGQLVAGYDADVIIVDGDPLADITLLAQPARITDVWKAGRRVKAGD
jgi:imidazolonepropionase-like amidohydrolase